MIAIPLAALSFGIKFIAVLWILVSLILILIVLVQKGKGGGLSAAFGGGAGGGLLGSKTGDFLTWFTIALVAAWLLLSVVAAKWLIPGGSDLLKTDQPLQTTTAPAPEVEQEPVSYVEMDEPNVGVFDE